MLCLLHLGITNISVISHCSTVSAFIVCTCAVAIMPILLDHAVYLITFTFARSLVVAFAFTMGSDGAVVICATFALAFALASTLCRFPSAAHESCRV